MSTWYHASPDSDLSIDDIMIGICLADDADAALEYHSECLYIVEIDDSSVVEDLGRVESVCGWYPCDHDDECYEYADRGVQAVCYDDQTPDNTSEHRTMRVIDVEIIKSWRKA